MRTLVAPVLRPAGHAQRPRLARHGRLLTKCASAVRLPPESGWGEDYFNHVYGGCQEDVSPATRDALSALADLLLAANKTSNLTSSTFDREDVYARHFADAATLLPLVDQQLSLRAPASLLDLGTGAGFPGLVLAAMRGGPGRLQTTLVDSVAKKTRFHVSCLEQPGLLGAALRGTRSLTARAEELGRAEEHREAYDVVTARAVAPMAVLAEYGLPLVAVGHGVLLASKSAGAGDVPEGMAAVRELGGVVEDVVQVGDAVGDRVGIGRREIVVVRKARATGARYPRRVGVALKRPL